MRRWILALCALALATPSRAQLLSLYPERSARDLQAALDGLGSARPRLALGQWRPYGLPVSVHDIELVARPAGLEFDVFVARQDWGPLGAWRLRVGAMRRLAGGLALGLSWAGERIDGGRSAAALTVDAALGQHPALVMSTRLTGPTGAVPRSPAAQLGLSVAEGGWILRLWRRQAGPSGVEEGIALERALGPLTLGVMSQWPGWQALAVELGTGRVDLRLEERVHPALGVSHGLRLLLR